MPDDPAIPLPRRWPRFAKRGLLSAIALGRMALIEILSGFENSPRPEARFFARIEQLEAALAARDEECRLLRARLEHVPPARRPHYPPVARLDILLLRAAQGWSAIETARRFQLAPQTIANWMKRLDEHGEAALVRTLVPVNRYPDFVAALAQQLGRVTPWAGRRRLAGQLARAGLHVAASTIQRMLARKPVVLPEPPPAPGPPAVEAKPARAVKADYPHHVWHVDLTVMPSFGGLWVPWLPPALAVVWPWCVWICAVVDHFSRAPVGWSVHDTEPSAADVCATLDGAVAKAGRAPRHIISDQGVQFRGAYRDWCRRNDVKPRFGKIGEHGSIAIIERFFLSLKQEYLRVVSLPLSVAGVEREVAAYVGWYVEHRPHETLGGATPGEVLRGELPAAGLPRIVLRARGDPESALRRRVIGRLELVVTAHEGRARLPVVELREVA